MALIPASLFDRPRPFTDDMRAMVEDLEARGETTPTAGERLIREALDAALAVIAKGLIHQALLEAMKGFHHGGFVKGPAHQPGSSIPFGSRGSPFVGHAGDRGVSPVRYRPGGAGTRRVTVHVGGKGEAR